MFNVHKYKQHKNKLISILKREEKKFYQRQIIDNKNNLRKVWVIIKEVINKNKTSRISDQFILMIRLRLVQLGLPRDSITILRILDSLLHLKK